MTNQAVLGYTKRPLNDAEREFAALPENHNLIFAYMKCKKLDAETFYDELILDYLVAVKQYVAEKPELQIKFSFKIFEALDESSDLEIADIETDDLKNIFTVETADGSLFEVECRKLA